MTSPSLALKATVRVEGIREKHLGPRMDFARVEFEVEPADGFIVVVQVPGIEGDAERQMFIDWAIFGFLDVVMVTDGYPVKSMKLTVVAAEFDAIDSSMRAFRLAGRDAGRALLEKLRAGTRPLADA